MKRITRPRAESLFTLYGGTECEPRQMMYRLLAEAMNREDTVRIDYLGNTIVVVINMRLDGIIEKLAEGAVSLRGKRYGGRVIRLLGEKKLSSTVRNTLSITCTTY